MIGKSYRIYTKEEYAMYLLSNCKTCEKRSIRKNFEEHWEKICNGYNIVIGTGKEDKTMIVYDVEQFKNDILGTEELQLIKRKEVIKKVENEQIRYINGKIKEAIKYLNPVIELNKKKLTVEYINKIKQEYFTNETKNTLIVYLFEEN